MDQFGCPYSKDPKSQRAGTGGPPAGQYKNLKSGETLSRDKDGNIKDEFAAKFSNEPGTLSMANSARAVLDCWCLRRVLPPCAILRHPMPPYAALRVGPIGGGSGNERRQAPLAAQGGGKLADVCLSPSVPVPRTAAGQANSGGSQFFMNTVHNE